MTETKQEYPESAATGELTDVKHLFEISDTKHANVSKQNNHVHYGDDMMTSQEAVTTGSIRSILVIFLYVQT